MFRTILIICIIGVVSLCSAMSVRTNKWTHGTEFHFTFTQDECRNMAQSWNYSSQKAHEILDNLANGWDGMGGGLILGRVAAELKVAFDLNNFSKDYVKYPSGPVRWTYSLQRRDGWKTPLKILDAIAGMWRKAAIKY